MLGNIINLFYRGLSIRRWNNYPRIENFVESEHISMLLHVSYIVSRILQEEGKEIDITYIYKNIFWSSFFTFIYSDIKFDVKQYLKLNYSKVYEKLWRQIYDFFESLNLPESLKKDYKEIFSTKFTNSLFANKSSLEDKVLQLSKEIVAKYEIEGNISFYPSAYTNIYNDKEKNISTLAKQLGFKEINLVYDYVNFLLRLKFVYRWNRMIRSYPVSVLAHLFLVFSFSYILSSLKGFSKKSQKEILTISLMHDIPEALTGDIITPTKKAAEGFSKALEEIETKLVDKEIIFIFSKFSFREEIRNFILNPFIGEIGRVAKMSDNLSAMFEAKIERQQQFKKIYYDIKKYLWLLEDKELDYILKYGVDYFDEDIETKWKKFIGMES